VAPHEPEISIVMPVRNEADAIDETLETVLSQVIDEPFEVVIAEGGSSDGTREILERWAAREPRVRLVDNPDGGAAEALNRALGVVRGRFLVRIDGHSRAPRDYVARLVRHLRSGACDGVGGRKRAVGRTPFGRAVAAAHDSRFGIGDSKYHHAGPIELVDHVPFGAYRADLARLIGGWDERMHPNEDYEFDYRYGLAGGRLLLDPTIVIDWRVRETPLALAKQYYAYGKARFRTLLRYPSSLHLRWLAPPALVLAVAAGAATAWTQQGRWLLAIAGGGYLLFLVFASLALSRLVGPWLAPRCALALAAMHLPWGVGFLAGALSPHARRVARDRPQTLARPSR
jgi:succinoglycan biosynthesis protein ExoA